MWPRPVEAVVFDMDGLLFDTESRLFAVMVEVAPRFGVAVDRDLFVSLIGMPIAGSSALLRARFGEDFPLTDFIKAVGAHSREVHANTTVPIKPGVVELLDHLDDLKLPYALCTSSAHEMVQRNLGQHNLLDRFSALVARGDYEQGKPAPDPFLKAAERLGVAPEACLALEDSHTGVRAATAAGMMTIMVPDMLAPNDEMRGLCLAVDESLHQVRGRL